MRKWSQYKIKYEPEWEKDSLLKDWLQPIPGDSRNARCGVCLVVLPAHHAGLCRHAQDAKHIKRVAEGNSTSKSQFNSYPDSIEGLDDLSLTVFKQEIPDSVEFISSFSDWIRLLPDDSTKVYCHLCDIHLDAEFQCLEDHSKTHRHQGLETTREETSSSSGMTNVASIAVSSSKSISPQKSTKSGLISVQLMPLSASFKCKPVVSTSLVSKAKSSKGNAAKDSFCVHSVTSALSSGESQLELVCENDDEYESNQPVKRTIVRSKIESSSGPSPVTSKSICNSVPVISSSSVVIKDVIRMAEESPSVAEPNTFKQRSTIVRGKRLASTEQSMDEPPTKVTIGCPQGVSKKFDKEWLNLAMFEDWLEEYVQDESRAWCRACQCTLSASVVHLQRHAMSFRHVRCMQPLDDNGTAPVFLTKNNELKTVSDSTVDEFEDISNRRLLPDDDEELSDEVTDGRRKRKSKDGKKWSKYKKMYRREWESDPLLQGWIAPVAGDRFKAACKYCCCILRAHYSDLRHHSASAKHGKNEGWHKSGGIRTAEKPVYFRPSTHSKDAESSNVATSSQHGTSSGCYVVQMSTWSKYRKRYSKQWEQDPLLRGWILPVPGDDSRARCRYCRLLLRAHYSDLRNHARTTKHASNVAFGRPCSEMSQTVGRAVNKTSSLLSTRRKKQNTVDLSDDLLLLDRPDDSLASLKSLTNLAQFGWEEPRGPETTLILHNGMHLDEQLAASLPQTPGLRFRVKKETLSAGYEQQASVLGRKKKDKTGVSSSPFVSSEEISDDMLKHLARSVTLWEFLMLKVNRGRPGSDRRLRIADILTEFSELQKKVKHISWQVLTPVTETAEPSDDGDQAKKTKKTLMLESKELGQCLGLATGRYEINQSAELTDSSLIDCRPLIPPLRRRTKAVHRDGSSTAAASSTTIQPVAIEYSAPSFEMIDGTDLRQYVIDPTDPETQSLLQGHILDGTGQQLVLVAADSGELLLQCDLKDYQTMMQNRAASALGTGYATLDDIRSLVGLQAVEAPVVMATASAEGEFEG